MRLYQAAINIFLLLLVPGCLAVDDDADINDDEESEYISPAMAARIPIYTATNTMTAHAPQHPRLMATEIRCVHSTICCALHPPCCSCFSLDRIYKLRIFFWSMEKTVAASWLFGFTSNGIYSIDKMVRYLIFSS